MARVSLWEGQEVSVSPLSGGLTNQNYVVRAGISEYVVRIPGPSTELLAVDRANERHNAEAAATTGVSPPVLEYLEDLEGMVLAYIEGTTMSAEALQTPRQARRVAASLRRLHSAAGFRKDFDMF